LAHFAAVSGLLDFPEVAGKPLLSSLKPLVPCFGVYPQQDLADVHFED